MNRSRKEAKASFKLNLNISNIKYTSSVDKINVSKKNLLTFMLVKKRFYEIGSLHGIKDTEDFLNK